MSGAGTSNPQSQHPWQNAGTDIPTHITRARGSALRHEIEGRLYEFPIGFQNPRSRHFWSPAYFDKLMTPSIVAELVGHLIEQHHLPSEDKGNSTPQQHWQNLINGDDQVDKKAGYKGANGFRRVLALLIMVGRCDRIYDFIKLGLTDDELPLSPEQEVMVFQDRKGQMALPWNYNEITLFCQTYQWRLTVPYFFFKQDGPERVICELKLQPNDIKPWEILHTIAPPADGHGRSAVSQPKMNLHSNQYGGFGEVRKVIIHPKQHQYNGLLSQWSAEKNIFALKRLFTGKQDEFDKEAEMLKRFGGIHPHIISLLATVICKVESGNPQFHLLFPWADTDLLRLWKQHPAGLRGFCEAHWLAEQCFEIVKAVNSIHNPDPPIYIDGRQKWGRHGDIKPQNVLCFMKHGDPKLKFVLSDLGLAQARGDATRSNIPGQGLPGTPNYRPPECDMAPDEKAHLGYVSRSYDIWTLGCLFLELTVWALQGWEEAENFAWARCSVKYLDQGGNDAYYSLKRVNGQVGKFALKKPVYKRFEDLYKHPDCTEFFRDLLDLVQKHMLRVRSDERIKTPELQKKMKNMCTAGSDEYYKKPCPQRRKAGCQKSVKATLRTGLRY